MKKTNLKKAFLFSLFFAGSFNLVAQQVALIDHKPVSTAEFMWVFKKNNTKTVEPSLQELESYLNLYVNFKLKVIDAKALGFDLDTNYQNEINGYKKALDMQNKSNKESNDYKFLMDEYRDGVLMFNISEQKVWNKAQADENKLKEFYEKNINNYNSKSYDEASGAVISDYQQYLEQEWIKKLRKKYPVKINKTELKRLARL